MLTYQFSNEPVAASARALASRIIPRLERGEKVVWLASGGSGTAVGVALASLLQDVDVQNLFVSLTDERYGPVGHSNENYQLLLDAGFRLPGASLYRPLSGASRAEETQRFAVWLQQHITSADYTIGLFGIGSDGHTAGIKPVPTATTQSDTLWAVDFTGEDFERITMTFHVIRQLDEAVLQAAGADKQPVIHQLLYENIPLAEQPAQILKHIPTTIITNLQEN